MRLPILIRDFVGWRTGTNVSCEQALIVHEDGTTSTPIELRPPGMGFTNSEVEAMRQREQQRTFEQSLVPNIVGIDQSALLRGMRSSNSEINIQSQQLHHNLQTLQAEIAALTVTINEAEVVPLRLELKTQYAECRRLLDLVEVMPARIGAGSNNQRQSQRELHTATMKLQNTLGNPPAPDRFPTDAEMERWNHSCVQAQQVVDEIEQRVNGWFQRVGELEREQVQLQRQFADASRVYVLLQKQIDILTGKPSESSGRKSSARSEYGL